MALWTVSPDVTQFMVQMAGAVGICITLVGVWLQWNLPMWHARIEDRHKDGRLSEMQMRRRMQHAQLSAMICTGMGMAVLIVALIGFALS